jgi:hypothetical protein
MAKKNSVVHNAGSVTLSARFVLGVTLVLGFLFNDDIKRKGYLAQGFVPCPFMSLSLQTDIPYRQ